jgi:hypothetical protein
VIVRGVPEDEHVHGPPLAGEPRGQLLGDESVVVARGDLLGAAALGQLVDLLGRRRALGQAKRALNPQLRGLGGDAVAVQICS